MSRRMIVVIALTGATLAIGGVALAQSTSHGPSMHGDMHAKMQAMHGNMHSGANRVRGSKHEPHDRQGHSSSHDEAAGDQSVATLAFTAANEKMHREMRVAYSGDADRDFLQTMIPHHQGAVDMAKIAIAFGKDPAVRKLAEEIMRAQESEIAFMRTQLQKQ